MRTPTAIDAIADDHAHAYAALAPLEATALGLPGYDHLMGDHSPAGHAERADLARRTLAQLDHAEPVADEDAVTLAAMRDRLGLEIELVEAGEYRADLNNLACPLQGFRDILDLMPTRTVGDWSTIAERVGGVPDAMTGYLQCLRDGVRTGLVPARRQVLTALDQADDLADPSTSFFVEFAASARPDGGAPSPILDRDLRRSAAAAAASYADLSRFLRQELLPAAAAEDACGRERYQRFSRAFVGATIDLDETYEWGLEELARVAAEQDALARRIAGPGASVRDAVDALDADPSRTLHGTEELRRWMQETSDAAIRALDGTHFDIAEPLHALECRIAPTSTGGIYYTGPTDDFSRPGRMWWSVPAGVTEFTTWREKTTVYHEGVPGHHLQIAQAVYNKDNFNLWRRLFCWLSGHGEGWALYAERLMEEFGFLTDDGDRFGMLDSQRLRATRVVLDLGVHLGKPAPTEYGGGTWDADKAAELLRRNVNMGEEMRRFELTRYLGWPGQAPSYKVGQRLWEQIRADAATAARARGEAFSLKDFHTRALNLGSLPLDVLRGALIG